MSDETAKVASAFAGAISAMHTNMHEWRDAEPDEIEKRDIDSAQVYLEAAFWKLEQIIDRAAAQTEKER